MNCGCTTLFVRFYPNPCLVSKNFMWNIFSFFFLWKVVDEIPEGTKPADIEVHLNESTIAVLSTTVCNVAQSHWNITQFFLPCELGRLKSLLIFQERWTNWRNYVRHLSGFVDKKKFINNEQEFIITPNHWRGNFQWNVVPLILFYSTLTLIDTYTADFLSALNGIWLIIIILQLSVRRERVVEEFKEFVKMCQLKTKGKRNFHNLRKMWEKHKFPWDGINSGPSFFHVILSDWLAKWKEN